MQLTSEHISQMPEAAVETLKMASEDGLASIRHSLAQVAALDDMLDADLRRRRGGVRRVYIAGPMRGYHKFNFPAFDAARDRFRAAGWDVISPADIDREHEPDTLELTDAQVSTPETLRRYARRDVEAILRCDAIAMLPGWGRSRGATAEYHVARWIGLAILDAVTFGELGSHN